MDRILTIGLCSIALTGAGDGLEPASVRLNQLQYIGTHNSYHIEPEAGLVRLMLETDYAESETWPADRLTRALAYTHASIPEQLDLGIRLFELDLHDDPEGGRFADPGFVHALAAHGIALERPIEHSQLLEFPGFKVFHTADTDVRSRCVLLRLCLMQIRNWSLNHPGHMPIIIQLETKEGRKTVLTDAYQPAEAARFTSDSFARLTTEIRTIFPAPMIVTPAEVQGSHESLNASVRTQGWPSVDTLHSRVIFMLLDSQDAQSRYMDYVDEGGELLLFPSIGPDDPNTAWLQASNPNADEITGWVEDGFLVYTRADTHTNAARYNDTRRRDRAFSTGAQLISTDFPVPDSRYSDYSVSFGDHFVRCNPVSGGDAC